MNSAKRDGVDTPDPMAGGHSAKRITHRMPMGVLFNIVDIISALNAMNIWLKFQTVLQFKNRARRSYSPYKIV